MRVMAGVSVRVRNRVRDRIRISNRVRVRVKVISYSLITALPIATCAHPLFPCPVLVMLIYSTLCH